MVANTQQGGKASKHKVDIKELPNTVPVDAEQQARKRHKKAAAKSDPILPESNGTGHPAAAVKQKAAAAASEGQPAAKKAKRDTQTCAVPANSAADALPIGEPAASKQGKKRKRRAAVRADPDSDLPEEERVRRQKQRELRKLALQMRAQGKAYRRPPQKKQATEEAKAKAGRPGHQQTSQAGKEETGSQPDHPVEVIVVPVFWNRKPDEKAAVIKAAQAVVELLQAADIQAGIDTTNAMSPGQKYRFWEEKGVMVRIECGPRDVSRNACVLAGSKKAGEVAEKRTIPVGAKLLEAVGAALGRECALPANRGVKDSGEAGPAKMETDAVGAGMKRAALSSGDDLGGDFGDLTVEEPEGKSKKHKKRRS